MKNIRLLCADQRGTTIIFVMLIMAVLIIVGVTAISTSITEVKVSTHDVQHKVAFYAADGGTEFAAELLEQNISCGSDFPASPVGSIEVETANFWMNLSAAKASDSNRDFYFPSGYSSGQPHTNITIGGSASLSAGGAIQMAAGYEGKGKGAPSGGGQLVYDIYSDSLGPLRARSLVLLQWRHVIGQELNCPY
jgi:Tfp pilus assembly protein PilX